MRLSYLLVLAAFLSPDIFTAAWAEVQSASSLEVAAVLTGVACVWLAARNSIWNFPIGIVNGLLYLVVFKQAKLYSDAGLQLAFICLLIYGWMKWLRGAATPDAPQLPITRTPRQVGWWLSGAGLLYAVVAGVLLSRHTDAALPYLDSTTTAISLAAQTLLSRRNLENWLLWIGVDVVYIGMYWHRHLYLTSGLYVVFTALAIYGYLQWRRELRMQQAQLQQIVA